MSPATKEDCAGCRDDFYNGHNDIGVNECWKLAEAKVATLYQIGYHTPMDRAENFRRVQKPVCWYAPGQFAVMKTLPSHLRGQEGKVPRG